MSITPLEPMPGIPEPALCSRPALWRYDGDSNDHPDGAIGSKTLAVGNMEGVMDTMIMHTHCCPATSRIESTGCLNRVGRFLNWMAEVPVEWAFSRIELG
jgi:hypothetical protein